MHVLNANIQCANKKLYGISKNVSKYHKKSFYAWLRWKIWCFDKREMR